MNSFSNTTVGAAAANVTLHGCVDIVVGWFRRLFQQGGCRHDLARLAVTALGYLVLDPRFLNGMIGVFGKALNGGNLLSRHGRNRNTAGTGRGTIEVNGTGSALGNAAAKFSTRQAHYVPNSPQQGHIGIDVEGMRPVIDGKFYRSHLLEDKW